MFAGIVHAVSVGMHSLGNLGMASTGLAAASGQALLGRRLQRAIAAGKHFATPPPRGTITLGEPHAHVAVID